MLPTSPAALTCTWHRIGTAGAFATVSEDVVEACRSDLYQSCQILMESYGIVKIHETVADVNLMRFPAAGWLSQGAWP